MPFWIKAAAAALAIASCSTASAAAEKLDLSQPWRSATKARDIGGFQLGMHIRDVAKLSPVEDIGNGGYRTERDGIKYEFEVTPLGRVYLVSSEQMLGRFAIDRKFLETLTAKLCAKFGPVAPGIRETFGWSLVESVERTHGEVLPFETNWASAYVSGSALTGEVTLYAKMLDFRYLWQDSGKLNRQPRANGEGKIAL
jgi:hypothetical protein